MKKQRIMNRFRAVDEICPDHPDCYELTCKQCHQISLDFAEMELMDLAERVKSIFAHASWDKEMGADSKWGWTISDFVVRNKFPYKKERARRK